MDVIRNEVKKDAIKTVEQLKQYLQEHVSTSAATPSEARTFKVRSALEWTFGKDSYVVMHKNVWSNFRNRHWKMLKGFVVLPEKNCQGFFTDWDTLVLILANIWEAIPKELEDEQSRVDDPESLKALLQDLRRVAPPLAGFGNANGPPPLEQKSDQQHGTRAATRIKRVSAYQAEENFKAAQVLVKMSDADESGGEMTDKDDDFVRPKEASDDKRNSKAAAAEQQSRSVPKTLEELRTKLDTDGWKDIDPSTGLDVYHVRTTLKLVFGHQSAIGRFQYTWQQFKERRVNDMPSALVILRGIVGFMANWDTLVWIIANIAVPYDKELAVQFQSEPDLRTLMDEVHAYEPAAKPKKKRSHKRRRSEEQADVASATVAAAKEMKHDDKAPPSPPPHKKGKMDHDPSSNNNSSNTSTDDPELDKLKRIVQFSKDMTEQVTQKPANMDDDIWTMHKDVVKTMLRRLTAPSQSTAP